MKKKGEEDDKVEDSALGPLPSFGGGGLSNNGHHVITLVVLRKPVDRLVSSMYFWNCERGTFPEVD
jgi:hypothetical protein